MMMQEQCIRFYGNVKDCYIARFLLQNSCSYIPYVKGLFTSTNEQVATWSSLMLLASKRKDICASPQSLFHFHTIQFLVMEFHVMLSFFFFWLKFTKQLSVLKGKMYIFNDNAENEGRILGSYYIFRCHKQDIQVLLQ